MEKPSEDFFGKKEYISRIELRQKLREAPPKFSDSGRRYTTQERIKVEKEMFGNKYGNYITRGEYKDRIRRLEKEKYSAKKNSEKIEIDRKIRFLKNLIES